jgi:tripartite-type tricarboxylate transporter receptor subunit TctC
MPDVPTVAEQGVPGFDVRSWAGWMLPAGAPRAIVDRLNAETVKALQNPAVKAKLANIAGEPMPMTAAQYDDFVSKEIDLNTTLAKAAGVKIE